MARKNKVLRWNKLRGGVLYISTLLREGENDHTDWMNRFCERLDLLPIAYRDLFEQVVRSGDEEAGELRQALLDPTNEAGRRVTAVVGVLTNVYLKANADLAGKPSNGELALFFDRALGSHAQAGDHGDCETPILIFLAPLDPPFWDFPVRSVPLGDKRWVRLREIKFTWPSESKASVATEIVKAARDIVNGFVE